MCMGPTMVLGSTMCIGHGVQPGREAYLRLEVVRECFTSPKGVSTKVFLNKTEKETKLLCRPVSSMLVRRVILMKLTQSVHEAQLNSTLEATVTTQKCIPTETAVNPESILMVTQSVGKATAGMRLYKLS